MTLGRYSFILILGLLISSWTFGQCVGESGLITFSSSTEAETHSVCYTSSDELLIAGVLEVGSSMDWVLVKEDPDGMPVFAKSIGFQNTDENGGNLIAEEMSDGSIVMAGYRDQGTRIALIVKVDMQGDLEWARTFPSNYNTPRDVLEAQDGGILVSGSVNLPNGTSEDAYLVKFSQTGDIVWGKRIDGGSGNDHLYGIAENDLGEIVAVGNSGGFTSSFRPYVVKCSADGTILDQVFYDCIYPGTFLDVFIDQNERIVASGYEDRPSGRASIFVSFEQDFEVIWDLGFQVGSLDIGTSIRSTGNGELTLFSIKDWNSSSNSIYIIKVDALSGTFLSAEILDGDLSFSSFFVSNCGDLESAGNMAIPDRASLGYFGINSCNQGACKDIFEVVPIILNYEAVDFSMPSFDFDGFVEISPDVNDIVLDRSTSCNINVMEFELFVDDFCEGEELTFELQDVSGTIVEVNWEITGHGQQTGSVVEFSPLPEGTYELIVTVQDVYGADSVETVYFSVHPQLEIEDILLASEFEICQGESISESLQSDLLIWEEVLDENGVAIESFEVNGAGEYELLFISECSEVVYPITVSLVGELQMELENVSCVFQDLGVEFLPNDYQFIDVDWGDGNTETINPEGSVWHEYSEVGVYDVTITGDVPCNFNETFTIQIQEPPMFESPISEVFICNGDEFTYEFGEVGAEIFDMNGQEVTTVTFNEGGTFHFIAENNCGVDNLLINVFEEEVSYTPLDYPRSICPENDGVTIGVVPLQDDGLVYQWSDGYTESERVVNDPGQYHLQIYSETGQCSESESFVINQLPKLSFTPLDIDTVFLCLEGQRTINFKNFGYPYSFQNGEVGFSYSPLNSGEIILQFNDGCYDYEYAYFASIDECACEVYIPNAFTPDEDGLNDLWKIEKVCRLYNFRVDLFNRFGQRIYTSKDPDFTWNGAMHDGDYYSENEIYQYIIQYSHKIDGVEQPKVVRGHVTLLR